MKTIQETIDDWSGGMGSDVSALMHHAPILALIVGDVQRLLTGIEWNAGTIEEVAQVLHTNDLFIDEPADEQA